MLGTKIYKNNFDEVEYYNLAEWCNNNGYAIEDKGDFYEVIEVDVTELQTKLTKENIANQINDINIQISALRGVSECVISVDGENEYDVFVDGKLTTMNEEEFQNYFDELTNKRSELLQQYKELK